MFVCQCLRIKSVFSGFHINFPSDLHPLFTKMTVPSDFFCVFIEQNIVMIIIILQISRYIGNYDGSKIA